jgi:hypothetical protein
MRNNPQMPAAPERLRKTHTEYRIMVDNDDPGRVW